MTFIYFNAIGFITKLTFCKIYTHFFRSLKRKILCSAGSATPDCPALSPVTIQCAVVSFDREQLMSERVSLQCLQYRYFGNCLEQWFQKYFTQRQVGNSSKPTGHYMYHQFNTQHFYLVPTHFVYVFWVDLRTSSDYFTVQHWLVGFYNRDGVCLLRGTFYVLPTQCIYVFFVDLRTNSDYFTVQHWLVGSHNWDGVCLLRGTDWVFS